MKKKAITKFLAEEMGWKIKTDSHGRDYFTEDYFPTISKYRWVSEFTPSTNITHVFIIVERLLKQGFEIEIESDKGMWSVMLIGGEKKHDYIFHGDSKELPEAITLAAARALASPDQAKELGI